jgi:hypothetical protein
MNNKPGNLHLLTFIVNASNILEYNQEYDAEKGFKMARGWYFGNLK